MDYIVNIGWCLGNGVDVNPGDIVQLTDAEAQFRLAAGAVRKKPFEHEPAAPPIKKKGGK